MQNNLIFKNKNFFLTKEYANKLMNAKYEEIDNIYEDLRKNLLNTAEVLETKLKNGEIDFNFNNKFLQLEGSEVIIYLGNDGIPTNDPVIIATLVVGIIAALIGAAQLIVGIVSSNKVKVSESLFYKGGNHSVFLINTSKNAELKFKESILNTSDVKLPYAVEKATNQEKVYIISSHESISEDKSSNYNSLCPIGFVNIDSYNNAGLRYDIIQDNQIKGFLDILGFYKNIGLNQNKHIKYVDFYKTGYNGLYNNEKALEIFGHYNYNEPSSLEQTLSFSPERFYLNDKEKDLGEVLFNPKLKLRLLKNLNPYGTNSNNLLFIKEA